MVDITHFTDHGDVIYRPESFFCKLSPENQYSWVKFSGMKYTVTNDTHK